MPDLLATLDVADVLGVSVSAVSNWTARDVGFPAPVLRVARGATPLYSRADITAWAHRTGRTIAP